MKKICCIFVASLLVISMTIPMVFAGAHPQQTEQVTEDSSSVEPERVVGSSFVYDPGSVVISDSTYYYDYTYNIRSVQSAVSYTECPQNFKVYNDLSYNQFFSLYASSGFSFSIYFVSSTATYVVVDGVTQFITPGTYSYFSDISYFSAPYASGSVAVINFTRDPQTTSLLGPVYHMLVSSGVNEEWSSIGVVIFAMLPIVTIWLIIGRVFKRKER